MEDTNSGRARLYGLIVAAAIAACSNTTTVADAGPPADVVTNVDVGVDVPRDVPITADVPPARDVPITADVPPTLDVPRDTPIVADVPPTVDVPVDTGLAPPCGDSAPESGSACTREGLACQYGDDPRESCRTTATCTSGRWQLISPRCVPITPPAMCPASRDVAAGMACATMNAVCNYGGLTCTCTNCRSFPVGGCSGPLQWRCVAPNNTPGCPAVQPNLGAQCAADGQRCGYDCEAYGVQGGRLCEGGVWRESSNNCPISTRAAKRDIRYLTPEESTAIAEEALRTRLATYEYTDPALRGPRRLGFIYEDPTTPAYARNPDISGVDLYGYTSMLLATVQRQQRQIEALQRAVAALRRAPAR